MARKTASETMREFERKRRAERSQAFRDFIKGIAGMIAGALIAGLAMATPDLTPGVFLSTVLPGMAVGAILGFAIGSNA